MRLRCQIKVESVVHVAVPLGPICLDARHTAVSGKRSGQRSDCAIASAPSSPGGAEYWRCWRRYCRAGRGCAPEEPVRRLVHSLLALVAKRTDFVAILPPLQFQLLWAICEVISWMASPHKLIPAVGARLRSDV